MQVTLPQRLLFVTGKGGVGKSTVAAAFALRHAREGHRTLVCEVNADERISVLLGKPAVGADIRELEKNLWAVDIRPQEAMREYALMVLRFKTLYRAVFENPVVRYFLRLVPSLQELVMIGKIFFHLREKDGAGRPRFDRIVVDAPATGHAVSFLSVPQVILDTVPPGPMANEAALMRDLLVDRDTTGVVLVTLPEEMPVNEAIDLSRELRSKAEVSPVLTVLNAFVEPRFAPEELAWAEANQPALKPIIEGHLARSRTSASSEERLRQAIETPLIRLPRLFDAEFGRQAVEQFADILAASMGRQP